MKKQITLRIDEDVLDWFKSQGKGYQSKMNDVLRLHMMGVVDELVAFDCEKIDTSAISMPELDEKSKRMSGIVDLITTSHSEYFKPMPKKK